MKTFIKPLPSNTNAAGSGDPAADVNKIVDALSEIRIAVPSTASEVSAAPNTILDGNGKVTDAYIASAFVKTVNQFSPDINGNINVTVNGGYDGSDAVKIANAQTITGVKTFSAPPVSTTAATTANQLVRKTELDLKANATATVNLTGDQAVAGTKTFTNAPVSSAAAVNANQLVRKNELDLKADSSLLGTKANSNEVVALTGAQTIAGVKTFSLSPKASVAASTSDELVRKGEFDAAIAGIAPISSGNTDNKVFSVSDYVQFDGTTNIRAGFQTALDAAIAVAAGGGRAIVQLPAGIGIITNGTSKTMPFLGSSTTSRYSTASGFGLPVNLPGYLTIRGQGIDSTVIKLSAACRSLFWIDKQNDYDTFQNVTYEDFTVDNNGAVGQNHVICGTVPSSNTPQTRLNLFNLTHRRLKVVGVPNDHIWDAATSEYTMTTTRKAAFVYHSRQIGQYEAGVTPGSLPLTPWPGKTGATAAKWNFVMSLKFEDIATYDAQRGILVVSDINQNSSIWYDAISLRRCHHEQSIPWESPATQTSFYVGGNCQGGRAEIIDCTSVNIADDGIEFGGLQELYVKNFKVVNPVLDGILVRYSQPPANASTVKIVVEDLHHIITAAAIGNDTITRTDNSTARRSLRSRPFEIKTENDALNLTLGQVILRNPKTVIEGGYYQSLNRSGLLGFNSSGPVETTIIENPLVALRNFTLDYSSGTYTIEMFNIRALTGEAGANCSTRVTNAQVLIENLATNGAKFDVHGITASGNGEVSVDGFNFTVRNCPSAVLTRLALANVGFKPAVYTNTTSLNKVILSGLKGTIVGATVAVRRGVIVSADETFDYCDIDRCDFRGWAITSDVDLGSASTNGPQTIIGQNNWFYAVPNQGRRNPQAVSYQVKPWDSVIAITSTSAVRTITLPSINTVPVGKIFRINDESNGAGTQNIIIAGSGSETFLGGSANRSITTNNGSIAINSNGSSWIVVADIDGALTSRLQVVNFGTTTATPRPAGVPNGGVYWIGSGTVLPSNALSADLVYLP